MSDGFAPRAARARTGPHCPKKDESRYSAWRARIALNGRQAELLWRWASGRSAASDPGLRWPLQAVRRYTSR